MTIVGVPTWRDADGLAMSSRNRYLRPEQRPTALALSAALAAGARGGRSRPAAVLAAARGVLAAHPDLTVDRLDLVDPVTLDDAASGPARLLVAGILAGPAGPDPPDRQHCSHARSGLTMQRTMLKSKIHRATVTQADLHYVGSVTVDEDLMEAADLLPGEQVAIVDITNGARLETYVITGPRGSGVIGINGAAARLVHPGDLVILIAYGIMDDAEARTFEPRVVFVDADNRISGTGSDPAEALPGPGARRHGRRAERLTSSVRLVNRLAGRLARALAGLDAHGRRRRRRLGSRRAGGRAARAAAPACRSWSSPRRCWTPARPAGRRAASPPRSDPRTIPSSTCATRSSPASASATRRRCGCW